MNDSLPPAPDTLFYNSSHAYFWSEAVIYQGKTTIAVAEQVISSIRESFHKIEYTEHDVEKMQARLREEVTSDEEYLHLLQTLPKATLPRDHEFRMHFLLHMHEHFFTNALGKSIDFLGKTAEFGDILNKILDSVGGLRAVTDLRNMREHDDEYIEGIGHAQNRFITHITELSLITDATSTSIDMENRRYLLGGKIDVFQTVGIYMDIISRIQNAYYRLCGF